MRNALFMAKDGANVEAIKNAVGESITPKIVELIRSQITTELNRFKAGNS